MSPAVAARAPFRLTLPMRLMLASMYQAAHPVYGYEISKESALEINVVLGQFHRLETVGFAERVEEPADAPKQEHGRARIWFQLTDQGREFAATTIESTHQLIRSQARSIGLEGIG